MNSPPAATGGLKKRGAMRQSLRGNDITVGVSSPPTFLTVDETALRWRVCRQTVLNYIYAGEIKTVQMRRKHLIPLSEIKRLEQL